MKELFVVLGICLLTLAGCATRGNQTSATEVRRDIAMVNIRNGSERVIKCQDDLRKESAGKGEKIDPAVIVAIKLVDSQVLYYADSSPNKVELMSSTAKITPAQKQALLTYLAANQKCRQIARTEFSQYPSFLSVYNNYYGDTDVLFAKLISREITIGEANRQKSALLAKAQSDGNQASEKLANQFNAALNQEAQAAQADAAQRRAIAAQYLMNQQNINAQQQMNTQNQINNNRFLNTTCNRLGDQVNCITQ